MMSEPLLMDEREHMKTTRASQTAASQRVVQQKNQIHPTRGPTSLRANEPTNQRTNQRTNASIARMYRSNIQRHVVAGRGQSVCVVYIPPQKGQNPNLSVTWPVDHHRHHYGHNVPTRALLLRTRVYRTHSGRRERGKQVLRRMEQRGPFCRFWIGAAFPAFRSLPHHLTAARRMMFDHRLLAARDGKVG
jgi:hypothetical protein